MALFVHDTDINVHKWRPKPDGFDISLQLSRHLHNLKDRICHSATALVPALSVSLRQIQFKHKLHSSAPQGSPVIHTLAWCSLLTLLQSPADPPMSEHLENKATSPAQSKQNLVTGDKTLLVLNTYLGIPVHSCFTHCNLCFKQAGQTSCGQ